MADYLVTYDVETETKAGRRRLRRVARACADFGQRVQLSVFEIRIDDTRLEELVARLAREIDDSRDSVRIYRLPSDRSTAVRVFGIDTWRDLDEPMVI